MFIHPPTPLPPLPPIPHRPAHVTPWDPDDVLRARLKTVGVSEYVFEMEVSAGRETGTEWRIVDVGGSRSQVGVCVVLVLFYTRTHACLRYAPIHPAFIH
jgi:guanine nucleotide-binding protein subunit alpha